MNTLNIILFTLLMVLVLSCQNQGEKPSANFNGFWKGTRVENFKNNHIVFSEIGDSIHIGHYLEFKGQPFFEKGAGIIKGDSIIYHVDVIRPIPVWGPDGGTHYLKLSKDKNTLEGIFITDSGHKGPLVFKRK
tara:strand:+ start:1130 stop:1528 length:399 start_codon:yes stop_codon:yes gene_type:complete